MATDFIPHSSPPAIERVEIGPEAIPALVVQPQSTPSDHSLPAVLIQHGYGAEKADLLPLASELVAHGFITLLPDAWGHGERFPASGPNWMTQISADYFMEVVRHTVSDMRLAFDYLLDLPGVSPLNTLVGGFSMGAIAALVYGTEDERVAGIISASGSPLPDLLPVRLFGSAAPSPATEEWAHQHDAATHIDTLAPKPLLIQHGQEDDMVPVSGAPLPDLLPVRLFGSAAPSPATEEWAHQHDAAIHIDTLAPKPLLIQHGQEDDMVPVSGALRLYEAAKPLYERRPDHLKLMLYHHTHLVTEQQIRDAVNWVAEFFTPEEKSA